MSYSNAESFIKRLGDAEFRKSLYTLKSLDDFDNYLMKLSLPFGFDDMQNAFNHLHGRCQTEEEAGYLKECYRFYKMLVVGLQGRVS